MMNLHGTPHNDVRLLLGLYLFLTARIHMCYWLRKRNGVCLCTIFAQGTKRKGVFFLSSRLKSIRNIIKWFEKITCNFFWFICVLSSLFIVNMCVHVCSCVFSSSSWVLVSRYKIIHLSFYRIYPVRSEFRKIPRLYTYVFHYKSQNIHIPIYSRGKKFEKNRQEFFFDLFLENHLGNGQEFLISIFEGKFLVNLNIFELDRLWTMKKINVSKCSITFPIKFANLKYFLQLSRWILVYGSNTLMKMGENHLPINK